MTIDGKKKILQADPLFIDLPSQQITLLAQKATEKVFPKKSFLISQGKPAEFVYIIYEGLVKIYMESAEGKIIPIRVKGPIYMVGELNLFDNKSTTNIEALKETKVLSLPKNLFLTLIKNNPNFSLKLLNIITEKLRAANIFAQEYATLELYERTWRILKSLSPHFPNKEITFSQEELAYIIGASRSKVTKTLDQLTKEKRITLSHRKITLL